MKFAFYAILFLATSFAFAAEKQFRYLAPDGDAEAFVLSVPIKNDSPEWTESNLYFRDYRAKQVTFKDFTSADGEHGLVFASGKWTPDSNYFIFTTSSSGGHSPWNFRTFIYHRKANTVIGLFDYLPPVVSPDFSVSAPDMIHLRVMDPSLSEPIDGKLIDVKLSEVLKTSKKTEQDAAANP